MIVLNLLNQLFGRRDSISRADIDVYQKGTSQQQRIEENAAADEFDSNALDGWSESGLSTDAMKKLDQRMAKKYGSPNYSTFAGFVLATLIIGSGLLLYFSHSPQEELLLTEVTETILLNEETERTEIDLIPEIEALEEIAEASQVRPQELIAKNIAKTKENQTVEDKSDQLPTQQDQLPVLPVIDNNPAPEIAPSLIYNQAKEIYLKDLKLIDYRAYRDGEITTERLRYSGTPANQAHWEQSSNEELVWEKVDIPYIDYIDKTMELISKNKYKKALPRLELILENYPDDINANFYSGLSYFNLGKYDLAIERFEKSYTIQYGNFYEEARWFKSLALENLKKHSEAKKLWKEIALEKGFYAKEAEKKLVK
jgi:tetratricopeptide (TPR) repeat protein